VVGFSSLFSFSSLSLLSPPSFFSLLSLFSTFLYPDLIGTGWPILALLHYVGVEYDDESELVSVVEFSSLSSFSLLSLLFLLFVCVGGGGGVYGFTPFCPCTSFFLFVCVWGSMALHLFVPCLSFSLGVPIRFSFSLCVCVCVCVSCGEVYGFTPFCTCTSSSSLLPLLSPSLISNQQERRMNVAITRARRHVAVIGDTDTVSFHPLFECLMDIL